MSGLSFLVVSVSFGNKETNKMEAQNKKMKYKPKLTWTDAAEHLLIDLWEEKCHMLRGQRKNLHVYEEIAADLRKQQNFCSNAEDVRVKIHNLTAKYKKEKALIGASGGSPSEWPLYAGVHRIVGTFKIHNVEVLESIEIMSDASSSATHNTSEIISDASSSAASAPQSPLLMDDSMSLCESPASTLSPPAAPEPGPSAASTSTPSSSRCAKRKKAGVNMQQEWLKKYDRLEKTMAEESQRFAAQEEEFIKLERLKVEALQKSADAFERMSDAFIEFLKSKQ